MLEKRNRNKLYFRRLRQPPLTAKAYLPQTVKKISRLVKILFIASAIFLFIPFVWQVNQAVQLAFFTPKVSTENLPIGQAGLSASRQAYAIPTQIRIPKVHVDLPIEQTAIINGIWQISQKGASHLNLSAKPGEKGVIVLYGHNTNDRFGPIRWLTKGEKIRITTTDRKEHIYIITQTMKVKPDQMDIFTKQKGEVLIMYTCDGFADLERFVIFAVPTRNI